MGFSLGKIGKAFSPITKVYREAIVRPVDNAFGTDYTDKYNEVMGLDRRPQSKPTAPKESAYSLGLTEELKSLALKRQIEQAMANGTGAIYNGRYYANPEDAKKAWAETGNGDIQYLEGLGDDVLTKKYLGIGLDAADEQARRELKLRQELGVANVEQALKELEASDPEGYAAQKRIKAKLTGEVENYDPESGDLGQMLRDARSEYALGAKLDDSTAREVEQAARAGQSARGNILGIGAATQEAMALGSAGEQRKQQRTQNLLGLETTGYGRKQQGLSNAQNFVLGNPISNQFGNLNAAATGAVNFNPINATKGTGLSGQLGTAYMNQQFAQDNMRLQSKLAEEAKGNPWMNMASGAAGSFLGAYTGGMGAGLAANAFKK